MALILFLQIATIFLVTIEIIIVILDGNFSPSSTTYIFVYINGVIIRTSMVIIVVGLVIDMAKIDLVKHRRNITGLIFMLAMVA